MHVGATIKLYMDDDKQCILLFPEIKDHKIMDGDKQYILLFREIKDDHLVHVNIILIK